ncbi:hypothetical protein CKF58_06375 [Psittacicella hinzii]|uniref:site-specific DNA-methyltransferase (adenine-specific) n=2 Tax=Psittacicella hinzii TaxID=2028575 RepID=A0A3A1YFP5_9GAMM|nr:hypothetical protein CKF58_06375 [Psittacicella hinzii]
MYKKAPIPFPGQKRNFINEVIAFLTSAIKNETGAGYVILDVFGGSGLLSHVAKSTFPQARVVFNDYDNARESINRLPVAIKNWEVINTICCKYYTTDYLKKIKRGDRILRNASLANEIRDWITNTPYLELHIPFINLWLCFGGTTASNKEELLKNLKGESVCFNLPLKPPENVGNTYLDGLEIVCLDFKPLLDSYANVENVIYILDPPYLFTTPNKHKLSHKQSFSIPDYIELLMRLKAPYMLMSSDESESNTLMDLLALNQCPNWKSLINYTVVEREKGAGGKMKRKEYIYTKFV